MIQLAWRTSRSRHGRDPEGKQRRRRKEQKVVGDENARAGYGTRSPRAWTPRVLTQKLVHPLLPASSFSSARTIRLRTTEFRSTCICYRYPIKSNGGTEKERGRKCSQNNKSGLTMIDHLLTTGWAELPGQELKPPGNCSIAGINLCGFQKSLEQALYLCCVS